MDTYEDLLEMYEILEMEDEDGAIEEFFVVDSLELENTTYFLVVEAKKEIDYSLEVTSFIFKGTDIDGDNLILEMLDEGSEYEEIGKLFDEAYEQELLDEEAAEELDEE